MAWTEDPIIQQQQQFVNIVKDLMFNSADEILLLENKPKFFIKYQEREPVKPPKRYSSKSEYENIKKYQKSQEVKVDKNRSNLPSYQQPTQNFITSQVHKNKNPSQTKLKQQISVSVLPTQRSKSLEKQRELEPIKEYPRIPIEYYDERDHGCGADGLRGRVIYKGYAPKNTYFFLKTLKPLKLHRKTFMNVRSDFELKFNSKFQSGNLSAVNRISQNQYWLFMREDTNTHGLRQWFYFQVMNRKAMKAKFRIYKFSKYYSLYRLGMKPFARNYHKSGQWKQEGEKIVYDYDPSQKAFFLEFQYQFQEDNESVQFATLPPYTYSMLKEYLQDLNENPNITLESIGQSLSGLDIPFITISDKEAGKNKKQAIFVLARTHPGETVSNFALESMIERILTLREILNYFDFFIVPMVNPDGVFVGNHRTGVLGQDLNRNFQNPDPQYFPEVEAIQNSIWKVRKTHKIRYLLDLHGHSARKNIFAYTDEFEVNTKEFLLSRILPKLLNDAISSFKYEYCVFRASKQKKNTARVYFSNKYKLNAITFEQSYGLLDFGCIGVSHWKNFGTALAECLLDFAKIFESGQFIGLQNYLSDEIKLEKEQIEKRICKHKKMLGIESVPDLPTQEKEAKKTKFENLKEKFLTKQAQKDQDYQLKEKKESAEKKINTQMHTQMIAKKEEKDDSSIASSELSSGDQDLQMLNEQLQAIKKDIVRIGCMKEGSKREKYNIADKKLELSSWQYKDEYRLHEQKSSMIPRILKLQMQRKQQYKQNIKRDMYDKSSLRRDRLALPTIRK